MTYGHLDILKKAVGIFDHVIVAVAESREKCPALAWQERVEIARTLTAGMEHVEIDEFDGLLCDFVRRRGARVIVRGLRAADDFAGEYRMAAANRILMPEVETVFLTPSPEVQHVKGSLVREIVKMGGNVSAFVAPAASKILAEHYRTLRRP